MISILCPTRKRPNNMETLCSSIKKTSFYDELEIILENIKICIIKYKLFPAPLLKFGTSNVF